MSSEVAIHAPATQLAITQDQSQFTPAQVTMLRHIGVEKATQADLDVFFHQCKRTGLDPFARQIYMIERWTKDGPKYTIQTGIDGYRLIGRRAADRSRETISVKPPQWAHEDGSWRDIWIGAWGNPVAARVVIERNGEQFTTVALFDEYKQTKRDGGLTQMWAQRPAGQIAKCAEALAWRMAFPQDLAGIYTDDEMGQADNPPRSETVAAPVVTEPAADSITAEQWQAITAAATNAGLDQPALVQLIVETIGRELPGPGSILTSEYELIMQKIGEA